MTKEERLELFAIQSELINEPFYKVGKHKQVDEVIKNQIVHFANLVIAYEREQFCQQLRQFHDSISLASVSEIVLRGKE
jgi:hypothetical protein